MPPESENEDQFSVAVEFTGPPVPYDLPGAVPINVERIPVAAVVAETAHQKSSNLDLKPPSRRFM